MLYSNLSSIGNERMKYNLLEVTGDLGVSSGLTSLQNRISEILDYRILGSTSESDIINLYSNPDVGLCDEIMRCGAYDHTMFESIDEYCSQKFPFEEIRQSIIERFSFEVHGIFPDHFLQIAKQIGYYDVEEIAFRHNRRNKKFNYVRPKFYKCKNNKDEDVFIVSAGSGRDYLVHYASMLRHVIATFSIRASESVKVVHYPIAESSIHVWTNLDNNLVKKDDIVILGYAEEINNDIKKDEDFYIVSERDTCFYTSTRYKNRCSGEIINVVGVKFSFWGCISAKLVTQICRLGAREIIYIGKLGSLGSPTDIYDKIFAPDKFLIMYHDKLVCRVDDLRNNFLEYFPELSTSAHVSVPTVLEEDYFQRRVTLSLKANSIDNEISQMALAVARFNRSFNEDVSFSAIHFATDYIRKEDEKDIITEFDLSNNRTREAVSKKTSILDKINIKLIQYLKKEGK